MNNKNNHGQIRILKLTRETPIHLGIPDKYPTELIEALKQLFSTKPQIKSAYLGWIDIIDSGEAPHYIFVIDTNNHLTELKPAVHALSRKFLAHNEIIDLIDLHHKSGLGENFLKKAKPFYQKQLI